MKHKKYFFLLLLFCGINFPRVSAQTLDQIIASHIKAIGGKEKIKNIKTVIIRGTSAMSFSPNMGASVLNFNSLTRITNGKGYRIDKEIDGLQGSSQTICYTDNTGPVSGWITPPLLLQINEPSQTAVDAKPLSMSEYEYNIGKDQIYIGNPFINYPSREMDVKLVKKFNGQYCISIKTDFWTRLYYIDINTFYISKIEERYETKVGGLFDLEAGKVVTQFKDYKNVSGVIFPHSVVINTYSIGNETTAMTTTNIVTGITVNEPIDNSIYNFPED